MTLGITSTQLGATYAVHELLLPSDKPISCELDEMHLNEVAGRDLVCGEDGFWRDITNEAHLPNGWDIDVGEITHRGQSDSLHLPSGPTLIAHARSRSTVISLGYVINLPRTPRSFPPSYLERLKADKLHPSLLGKLLKPPHPPIELSNSETLEHPGWNKGSKVVVLGDTSDASGIKEIAMGADLSVFVVPWCHI